MSNLSKTTSLIIFQLHLVIVVAPKACNFGNSVGIEIRCGGDLQLISVISRWNSSEIKGILYIYKDLHRFRSSYNHPQTSKQLWGRCITIP